MRTGVIIRRNYNEQFTVIESENTTINIINQEKKDESEQ